MRRKTFGFVSFLVLLFCSLIAFVPGGTGKPGRAAGVGGVAALLPPAWGNPTTSSISSSANPSVFGQSVTLTATVTSNVAGDPAKPTGKVAFKEEGKTIGGILNLADGTASLKISSLAVGSHTITVKYSGDAKHQPSFSEPLDQSVIEPAETAKPGPGH